MNLVLLFATSLLVQSAAESGEVYLKAKRIHREALTIDAHVDIPFDFASEKVDPGKRDQRQVNLPKMIDGGMDAAFFNVYVAQTERTSQAYALAKKQAQIKFDAIHRMSESMYPNDIQLAYSSSDVSRIHEAGRLVAMIGIENGFIVGRDITLVERYYRLGARYMGLAHGGHNDLADSSTPLSRFGDTAEEHGGLSDLGRQVVKEMNRLGMIIDVSHLSTAATFEILKLSEAPVIASHSGVKAVADVPRNMSDRELLELKKNRGVIHAIALGAFVRLDPPEKQVAIQQLASDVGVRVISGAIGPAALAELSPESREKYTRLRQDIDKKWPLPDVVAYVDHVEHVANLLGVDHVGIGSDFDGGGGIVGWTDASETFNITLELVKRGYTEEEIKKIWGGNLLRVWKEVEQVASDRKRTSIK